MVVIMGDLNVHFEATHNMVYSHQRRLIADLISSFGLHLSHNEITRRPYFGQTGEPSSLDIFLTNFERQWYDSFVSDTGFSDHQGVEFRIFHEVQTPSPSTITFRKSKDGNIAQLRFCLSSQTWFSVYSEADVGGATNEFLRIFLWALNLACPWIRKRAATGNNSSRVPFDEGLVQLRDAYVFFRELALSTGDEEFSQRARECRSRYRHAVQSSKRKCNDEKILTATNKSRASWDVVAAELNSRSRNSVDMSSFDSQGFSRSFSEVFNRRLPSDATEQFYACLSSAPSSRGSFSLRPVSVEVVYSAICSLKSSKSADYFGISSWQ
ncbi:unnamed protein product, partial [Nesidiocoris tenuis]